MSRGSLLGALLTLSASAWAGPDAGSPRLNYMLHCSGCHGQDGSGNRDAGVPDFRGTLGHFLKVEAGREFLIQVPGTAQSPLPDRETAELANWLLQFFAPGSIPPGSAPYTVAEVSRLRASQLADVPARRHAILERLLALGIRLD